MPSSQGSFDPSPRRAAPRWALIALAVIAAAALAHHSRSAWEIVTGLLRSESLPRMPYSVRVDTPAFRTVRPEAEAAGLLVGDVPVRLGAAPYVGTVTPWKTLDGLPATRLVDRIFECADAFVAGAPQHDDMTVVIIRVLPI